MNQERKERILVTGAFGQIGYELVPELQAKYGVQNVIALGHKHIPSEYKGVLEKGSVTDEHFLRALLAKYQITQIYHMAALLSVTGEDNPNLCWELNLLGVKMILDLAVQHKLKVFWPSSIGCFGPTTPRDNTPQHTVNQPITMYGVTKYSGELLCQYYNRKYNLDVRSLRYPGIISWKAPPGGGTTDYSVAIFYEAIKCSKYQCFVSAQTMLPMMYMDDAIRATIQLMQAPGENIRVRTSYNVAAISFTAEQLAQEVRKLIPEFEITYKPDHRQKNADSWPRSIDDSEARKDWGWEHRVDLPALAKIMVESLRNNRHLLKEG